MWGKNRLALGVINGLSEKAMIEAAQQTKKPLSFISVTVDKSHIITIGEKLYSESIELIRELVNNAYDADATRVEVWIQSDEIVIRSTSQNFKSSS